MTVIMGIDLGSRRCGCVAATEALPLHVHIADVVQVPPFPRGRRPDVQPVVDELVYRALACHAVRVVIEHSAFYSPAGASPQQAAAMAQAHEICSHIEAGLYRELPPYVPGSAEDIAAWAGLIPRLPELVTIPRARWAHRVVPHTSGGITDDVANEGLQVHITPDSWEQWLSGGEAIERQDKRDAAGAIVGWLLPAPRRARKPGETKRAPLPAMTQEQKLARRRAQTLERVHRCRAPEVAERVAAGCLCFIGRTHGGGRHKAGCPLAPPPRIAS